MIAPAYPYPAALPQVSGPLLSGSRVLVIDDEPGIRRVIEIGLTRMHFLVKTAGSAAAAIDLVRTWNPHAILLDLGLPDRDGFEVCAQLRSTLSTPIIILSCRTADSEKIAAFDLGADDYMTKPFSIDELAARVKLAMRHAVQHDTNVDSEHHDHDTYRADDLHIEFATRQVLLAGSEVRLTVREYEVVRFLARFAGRVVSHHVLLRAVWGPAYEDEMHYLHVVINALRRKLEPDPRHPQYLFTDVGVGVGYRLRAPE